MIEAKHDIESERVPLSYEEFTTRYNDGVPRYNNFVLFFKGDHIFTKKPYFKQLCNDQPALALEIILFFQGLEFLSRREQMAKISEIEPKMYEAYKFFHELGIEDSDLFT